MTSVKWLTRMTVRDEPSPGTDEPLLSRAPRGGRAGDAITTIAPRSDGSARHSGVPLPAHAVVERPVPRSSAARGRGRRTIVAVAVSTDGGSTWAEPELGPPTLGRWAWRSWRFEWDAQPGRTSSVAVRATRTGTSSPLEPAWNLRRLRQQRRPARRGHGSRSTRPSGLSFRRAWAALLGAVLAAGIDGAGRPMGPRRRRHASPGRRGPSAPRLALTSAQQNARADVQEAGAGDGMLFVVPGVQFDGRLLDRRTRSCLLKIVFFDTRGGRSGRFLMTPCRRGSRADIYDPVKQYRYALELPADGHPVRRGRSALSPAALRALVRPSRLIVVRLRRCGSCGVRRGSRSSGRPSGASAGTPVGRDRPRPRSPRQTPRRSRSAGLVRGERSRTEAGRTASVSVVLRRGRPSTSPSRVRLRTLLEHSRGSRSS
jgi:hypothetical protein